MADKIVLDTNVVVDAIWHRDRHCSDAIYAAKEKRHSIVVCRKLLDEYRKILRGNGNDVGMITDRLLMQFLPVDLMEERDTPTVEIDFGPLEDRFHMQLAINAGACCHVTKDKDVLAEGSKMSRLGVKEVNPKRCADCWQ